MGGPIYSGSPLEWISRVELGFGVIFFGVDGASIFKNNIDDFINTYLCFNKLKPINFLIKEFLLCLFL